MVLKWKISYHHSTVFRLYDKSVVLTLIDDSGPIKRDSILVNQDEFVYLPKKPPGSLY